LNLIESARNPIMRLLQAWPAFQELLIVEPVPIRV